MRGRENPPTFHRSGYHSLLPYLKHVTHPPPNRGAGDSAESIAAVMPRYLTHPALPAPQVAHLNGIGPPSQPRPDALRISPDGPAHTATYRGSVPARARQSLPVTIRGACPSPVPLSGPPGAADEGPEAEPVAVTSPRRRQEGPAAATATATATAATHKILFSSEARLQVCIGPKEWGGVRGWLRHRLDSGTWRAIRSHHDLEL